MLALPAWRKKQEVTTFWTYPLYSASQETHSYNILPVLPFRSAFCPFSFLTAPFLDEL